MVPAGTRWAGPMQKSKIANFALQIALRHGFESIQPQTEFEPRGITEPFLVLTLDQHTRERQQWRWGRDAVYVAYVVWGEAVAHFKRSDFENILEKNDGGL